MSKFLLVVLMMLASTVNSAPIFSESGTSLANGIVYYNVGDATVGSEINGIGQISEIRDSDGTLIWNNGTAGYELNYYFSNLIIESLMPIPTGVSYGDSGLDVKFVLQEVGSFAPTGNWLNDILTMVATETFLEGNGHAVDYSPYGGSANWVSTGLISLSADSNSGVGWLDITGGTGYNSILQNTLQMLDLTLSDMTFNYSASNINTAGYDFAGSIDFAFVTATVDEPNIMMLIFLGLITSYFLFEKRLV